MSTSMIKNDRQISSRLTQTIMLCVCVCLLCATSTGRLCVDTPGNIFRHHLQITCRIERSTYKFHKTTRIFSKHDSSCFLLHRPPPSFPFLSTYVHCCVVEVVSSSGRQLEDALAWTCRARIISLHGKVSLFPS